MACIAKTALAAALCISFAAFLELHALARPAQSAEPRTVIDYFLLVPERYVGYDRQFREELLRSGRADTLVDVQNGYISYRATDNPEAFEFAIFKKPDGKYLIAFSIGYDPDFPDTPSKLLFLNYENGKWSDVTRASLPVAFNKRLTYKLPREGRNIVVTDDKGRRVYTLAWAGGKFSVSKR
ncbi:MAG TPA: hypothetical protein VD966_00130 [Pyrinomonadaceae bacterium]|nr:hypothetical protein [Pyrinomonadaceae bacterium]